MKFWTPNLGARVPTDLSTGIPDYSEYLTSGPWCYRRMLGAISGNGGVTYPSQGARVWPTSLSMALLDVHDSRQRMVGVGQEQFLGADVVLHCLEGQVALLHHVMAFEEANHGRKVLTDTQRWKATFAAYFLGVVSQSQLALLERTTKHTASVSYTSSNNWVVSTSKKLSWELRHNENRSLGRLNDALFENLPALQAFKWAPLKILAFLLSNSKSRFQIQLQLRELMFDQVGQWDIYISLSAFQGHTRYSDVASDASFGRELDLKEVMSLGYIFHCTKNGVWDSIRADGLLLSKTRGGQAKSRQAIHFVYAGGEVGPEAGTVILYGKDIFYCQLDAWLFCQAGNKLYLTGNGVVLSHVDVPTNFFYFSNRPPHEQDEGSKRWNRRQQQPREEGGYVYPESYQNDCCGKRTDGSGTRRELIVRARTRIVGSGTWPGKELSAEGWKRRVAVGTTSARKLRHLRPPSVNRRVRAAAEEGQTCCSQRVCGGRRTREHCEGPRGAARAVAAPDSQ